MHSEDPSKGVSRSAIALVPWSLCMLLFSGAAQSAPQPSTPDHDRGPATTTLAARDTLSNDATASLELGRRLYHEGILPDGSPLAGRVMGGAPLSGRLAACVRCHRASGHGINEGELHVPALNADILFAPLQPRRDRLLRELYQERQGPIARLRAKTPRSRPPYSDVTQLQHAVNDGVVPGGARLSEAMPRYALDRAATAALNNYLHTLGAGPDPGVDEQGIHFATVIGPDVPPAQASAMLTVMQTYLALQNRELARERSRASFSPYYKASLVPSRRHWQLHVWRLQGPADGWQEQLDSYYQDQPVFAMLGGMTGDDWRPVHRFCEVNALPCLFPETDWPQNEPGHFTLYLSEGLPGEIDLLADDLATHGYRRVVQIGDDSRKSRRLTGLLAKRAEQQGITLRTIDLRDDETDLRGEEALVLMLDAGQIRQALQRTDVAAFKAPVHALGGLLSDDLGRPALALQRRLHISWSIALPEALPPRIFRLRSWLRARRVADKTWERTQLNAYLAMDVAHHAMRHLLDRYSRELLIETVEHEIENGLNPGTFRRLSLGPGQRHAARGAAMLWLGTDGRLRATE